MTITVGIDQREIDKIKKKLDPELFEKALDIALFRIGLEIQAEAKKEAPYITGNLRRSITVERDKMAVRVGTNLVYGRILDQGGTIPARTIRVQKAKVLTDGVNFFGREVNQPARTVKPFKGRGYLTPAWQRQADGRATEIVKQEVENLFKN